jgi:thiopurine S-methyltransferase
MEPSFWIERWQRGETGFNQPDVHAELRRQWPALRVDAGASVFVPLCGKSVDMAWLRAQGLKVIGIELAESAVQDFFAEQGIRAVRDERHGLPCFAGDGISLYCGDFFALPADALADVAAAYDRAALIALPPSMRVRYARHVCEVLPRTASILQLTMEYEQAQMAGPPFSVDSAELHALYGAQYRVQPLSARDTLAQEPRFRERGLAALRECSYVLTPRAR